MYKTGCILGEEIFMFPCSPKAWEERHELDTALNHVLFMLLCAHSQAAPEVWVWCVHLRACCRSLCLMWTIDLGMTSTSSGVRFWCPTLSCTFDQDCVGRAPVVLSTGWGLGQWTPHARGPQGLLHHTSPAQGWAPGDSRDELQGWAGLTPRPARSRLPRHLHWHSGGGSLLFLQEEEKVSCRPLKHTQKLWTPLFTSTLSSVPFFKVSREMLSGYLNKNVILEWDCC